MTAKIVSLRPPSNLPLKPLPACSPYDQLTDAIVLAQAAAGTLNPAIVAALLAAVRQPAGECDQ